jgi:dTDP-4-amino-4,6-dideoxygalactose transaminase
MNTLQIPLVDLGAQFRPLRDEILTSIGAAIDSTRLFLGPNVQAFESEYASYCEVEHAIGVSDGTTALKLALMACGVGPGDEVITVSHTFFATVEAIMLVGALPVFVDIDPVTYTMNPAQIEAVLTPRTRAIIPVHLYGQPADMDPILKIARERGLWVIEDACQAHGARYKGRRAGSLGDVAAFSFYFSKNLGAYGEAGMVTTGNAELASRVRMLRDHGSPVRYHHDAVGMNGRLDEIQAAVLRIKLPHLEGWNARRQTLAAQYAMGLADLPGVCLPQTVAYADHVFHLYVVQVPRRDELIGYLRDRGIGTGIHYPIPAHQQAALRGVLPEPPALPITEWIVGQIISLPIYPELTSEQAGWVTGAIRAFYC